MNRFPVLFEPGFSVQVPELSDLSFPAVPSAYYYYGNRIPLLNIYGTDAEKRESLQIWYSFKSKDLFPVKTCYAEAREEQLSSPAPFSEIALSMKDRLRQEPQTFDWFYYDRLSFILSKKKHASMTEFYDLFYMFPFNPSAYFGEAARLLEQYFDSGDESLIRRYFEDLGVKHLKDHPLGYYPVYELFFLMTRFASYPMSAYQLKLAQRRVSTEFNSPERIFIDSVFYETDLEVNLILETVEQIRNLGSAEAGKRFGATGDYWVHWADEYLHPKVPESIENLSGPLSGVVEKLYTWTDQQIERLLKRMDIPPPFKQEYPARYPYVASIVGTIKFYRADVTDLARWIIQTDPNLLGMGSVS